MTTIHSIFQSFKGELGHFEEPYHRFLSLMPFCLMTELCSFVVLNTKCTRELARNPENWYHCQYKPHDINLGIIKKISISDRMWDGRNVVKGLKLHFQDHRKNSSTWGISEDPVKIGLSDNQKMFTKMLLSTKSYELGEEEYISYVEGRQGYMINQLTFVTNKNRKLGPVGGEGGSPFCTLSDRHKKLLDSNGDEVKVVLRGIIAAEGEQQGSLAIGRVQFISTIMCKPGLEDKWRDALV
jgi:hypothetical protein